MENESVVAATLQKFKGKIRLLEAASTLEGFRFQPGLTSWPFLNMKTKREVEEIDEARKQPDADPSLTYFNEYANFYAVPENQRS
mmetsp:Transcript_45010/g.59719  ORF Transcript_45010/g.59719 Transcript_45010/m.59719 type:complete len:85 (+) Transcript_45010:172-426(+)